MLFRPILQRTGAACLLAVAGLTLSSPQTIAQDLTVVGHAVHQRTMTGEAGGDFAGQWATDNGVEIEWLTFNVAAIHERLYREASLNTTTVDVGFAANRFFLPQFNEMFKPLDDYLAAAPIEAFEELPQGMLDALTIDGQLYGIPYRHATAALHINTVLLEQAGLSVPSTFEEVLAAARAMSGTGDDGTRVFGLLLDDRTPTVITDIARAQGNGDFITPDFQLFANSPEMIAAVQTVRDLFDEGVLPETYLSFLTEDVITFMQQGRGAMAISPFGRNGNFNNPDESQYAGQIITIPLPASENLTGFDVAPVRTEFWAMFIPKNADNADLAWDFIRTASSPANTIAAALNGNGPVRPSAYEDPRMSEKLSYAEAEQTVLAVARPPVPGWDNSAQAQDIFVEEVELALLGLKTPEEAMNSVQERVTPLLPQ
jgi:multiple sugar transport system substrate-binding protein